MFLINLSLNYNSKFMSERLTFIWILKVWRFIFPHETPHWFQAAKKTIVPTSWTLHCRFSHSILSRNLPDLKLVVICQVPGWQLLFHYRTSNWYFPWKKLSYTQKKGGSGPLLYCCCGSVPTIFSSNASNYQGKCLLEALFPGIRPVTFAVKFWMY